MKSGRNLRFYISALVMGLVLALELSACGSGGSGTVTTPGGFTPSFGTTASSVSSVTTTYTIGGYVSAVSGTLDTNMVLQNNASDPYTVTAGTLPSPSGVSFTFSSAVASGATYAVTVSSQPANVTCTVTSGTGTATSNVTNVNVQC